MATKQRIYIVSTPDGQARLVRASLRQQALAHVANSTFTVRVATPDDAYEAAQKNIKVEDYKDPDQRDMLEDANEQ